MFSPRETPATAFEMPATGDFTSPSAGDEAKKANAQASAVAEARTLTPKALATHSSTVGGVAGGEAPSEFRTPPPARPAPFYADGAGTTIPASAPPPLYIQTGATPITTTATTTALDGRDGRQLDEMAPPAELSSSV
jgi:hypothetical protein